MRKGKPPVQVWTGGLFLCEGNGGVLWQSDTLNIWCDNREFGEGFEVFSHAVDVIDEFGIVANEFEPAFPVLVGGVWIIEGFVGQCQSLVCFGLICIEIVCR